MYDKQSTGLLGEKLAADFLQQKGFQILSRNYRWGRAEIDLVAASAKLLLFVEVKTRRGKPLYGYPEEAVSPKKAALIINAASNYIEKMAWPGDIRFDIISIQLPLRANHQPQIYHIEDAFY